MKARAVTCVLCIISFLASGCASVQSDANQRHTTRVISYLYPDVKNMNTESPSSKATLHIPLRVGIAFVPEAMVSKSSLPETEQVRLLNSIKSVFSSYPFISSISIIPPSYLTKRGGFADLERAAKLFNIDVITLLSYDQVQFSDATGSSFWYWTLVGAYLVDGDEYDISTLVEASTFDIKSRRLLFRASGISTVAGSGKLVGYLEKARTSRQAGFNKAIELLIPNAQEELEAFREQAKDDPSIDLIFAADYNPDKVSGDSDN